MGSLHKVCLTGRVYQIDVRSQSARYGCAASASSLIQVGKAAHDADDRIIYKASGVLSYDADGSGAQAAVQFAVLASKPVVSAGDFLVI